MTDKPEGTTRKRFRTVFLGAPGAGKGTQAQILGEGKTTLGAVLHISTGDMLRQHVADQSTLGKQAKGYMDKGALVPDDLIIAMVEERLRKPDANEAWILDGFPRTVPQAQALDRSLAGLGKALSSVIYFRVPAEVLVKRLTARWTCTQCGAIWNTEFRPTRAQGICDTCGGRLAQRPDDRPEAVTKRLEVFRVQTEPLLTHYRGQKLLVEVDANRPPEQVLSEVLALANRA
jgi:adenylate kinase